MRVSIAELELWRRTASASAYPETCQWVAVLVCPPAFPTSAVPSDDQATPLLPELQARP